MDGNRGLGVGFSLDCFGRSPRNDVYGSVFWIAAPLSRLAMTGWGCKAAVVTRRRSRSNPGRETRHCGGVSRSNPEKNMDCRAASRLAMTR
jgi:hypothetical protein